MKSIDSSYFTMVLQEISYVCHFKETKSYLISLVRRFASLALSFAGADHRLGAPHNITMRNKYITRW